MASEGGGSDLPAFGIVADDLTGAGDCAVKLAEAGWQVEVDVGGGIAPLGPGMAVATTTDARSRDDTDASRRTAAAVTELRRAGAERLYVKVDSTLRGSVGAQIDGALAAWTAAEPDAFALLCPAYPAMGRTIVGGELLVNGVPVADERVREARTDSRVLLADAATDADLDRLAAEIERLGRRVLPVGSAGLAAAIARRTAATAMGAATPTGRQRGLRPEPSVVVAVSSRHPIAAVQLEILAREVGSAAHVRVVTAPPELIEARDGGIAERLVAEQLAADVERLLGDEPASALVLVGGDGALAVLRRLGAVAVRVHGSAAEGVPLGVARGGALDGVVVLTKSGGFGEPGTLHRLVRSLIDVERTEEELP